MGIPSIQKYLDKHDRPVAWFAARLGVSPSTVSRWIAGTHVPDIRQVSEIREVFGKRLRDAVLTEGLAILRARRNHANKIRL